MMILVMTIPVTLTMVILFLIFFVLAARNNQFDDLETPKHSPMTDNSSNDTTSTAQKT